MGYTPQHGVPSCGDCVYYLPADFEITAHQLRHGKCSRVLLNGEPLWLEMARGGSAYDDGLRCGRRGQLFRRKPRDPQFYDFENDPPEMGAWCEPPV